jgi:hypothetical protein
MDRRDRMVVDNKHEIVSIIVKVFPGQLLPGKYLSYIMAVSLLMEEIGVPGENHRPAASH